MFDTLTYEPRARAFLAEHLKQGSLLLFLGAGISYEAGIPTWIDLVNRMRNGLSLSPEKIDATADRLQISINEVRTKLKTQPVFFESLKKSLYQNIQDETSLSAALQCNSTLAAIGALLMGSNRGHVRRVLTLNFDSILECYLFVNGLKTRIVDHLPSLEGSEDVIIYHPHGYLPHDSLKAQNSDFLIFDHHSANKRIGTRGDDWFELSRHLLLSSVCLFVGVSPRTFLDRTISPLLADAAEKLSKIRPTGVWLLKDKITQTDKDLFLQENIVPVEFTSKDEINHFLYMVCREAANSDTEQPWLPVE